MRTWNTWRRRAGAILGATLLTGALGFSVGCGRHEATPSNYYTGPMVKKDQSNRVNLASASRPSSF